MKTEISTSPIGIFDSGVGGLSVWREVRRLLPYENTRYVADQAHIPYGPRRIEEVREFAQGITEFLMSQGCKAIVLACNTASGAALHALRKQYPDTPFIGMEPAVKPAAERTKTGAIGVIATPTTLQGDLFHQLVTRFGSNITIHTQTCPGLVEIVESGQSNSRLAEKTVQRCVEPLMKNSIDQLVLGCTHYPFLTATIKRIIGPEITLVDPSPAIAKQIERVLQANEVRNPQLQSGHHVAYTSGSGDTLENFIKASISPPHPEIRRVNWQAGQLAKARGFV